VNAKKRTARSAEQSISGSKFTAESFARNGRVSSSLAFPGMERMRTLRRVLAAG
jgi:hypothetical protein